MKRVNKNNVVRERLQQLLPYNPAMVKLLESINSLYEEYFLENRTPPILQIGALWSWLMNLYGEARKELLENSRGV